MPNQLAAHRTRLSIAEHRAVVAAATLVAHKRGTTLTDLLAQSFRSLIRAASDNPACALAVQQVVLKLAPELPPGLATPVQLRRFKREQREFDQVVLDLGVLTPEELQVRNSINSEAPIRAVNFLESHASVAR